jgi:Uri superfamily endonuclease
MIGTYALILQLKKHSKMRIGKLGSLIFQKGYYCYVGSAFGKTMSLENRIKRYERLNKEKKGKLKWHIDYFLINPNASIKKIVKFNGKKIECKISRMLEKHAQPIINFGCSDCKCKSHFYYSNKENFEKLLARCTFLSL